MIGFLNLSGGSGSSYIFLGELLAELNQDNDAQFNTAFLLNNYITPRVYFGVPDQLPNINTEDYLFALNLLANNY